MKLVIDGRTYDASAQPFIGDLRLIKKEFGYGYGTVIERVKKLDVDNIADFLDDDDALEAFVAWLWMVRLRAGERDVTRADVEMTALDQIQWVPEPADETPDAAPTPAPTDSGRGDDEGKGTASKLRSTTPSKKPSTAA